jgi:hypothetical protein
LPTQTEKNPPKSPDFSKTIPITVLAENPLKFLKKHIITQKGLKYPQNIDVLSKNNF